MRMGEQTRTENELFAKLFALFTAITAITVFGTCPEVIIIAFSWIPPAIVAYVVREREVSQIDPNRHQTVQDQSSSVIAKNLEAAEVVWNLADLAVTLGCSIGWKLCVDSSALTVVAAAIVRSAQKGRAE